jgi:hypothetical protein
MSGAPKIVLVYFFKIFSLGKISLRKSNDKIDNKYQKSFNIETSEP